MTENEKDKRCIKMKLTCEVYYKANFENYPGCKSAEDIASLDLDNADEFVNVLIDCDRVDYAIEPFYGNEDDVLPGPRRLKDSEIIEDLKAEIQRLENKIASFESNDRLALRILNQAENNHKDFPEFQNVVDYIRAAKKWLKENR